MGWPARISAGSTQRFMRTWASKNAGRRVVIGQHDVASRAQEPLGGHLAGTPKSGEGVRKGMKAPNHRHSRGSLFSLPLVSREWRNGVQL